ncbi:DUF5750 family protein [uncultured Methanobrevibacter sp.]|uniref:DUF5750 family protein n=1 Tax=uncultured Methanobrevibacter sp. TaxID=253161 RepID=UPI002612C228
MFTVKVDDYGETEDQMHYVTYMISGLSDDELNFLIHNLEGEIAVEDGNLFLNIFYSRKFFPFASEAAQFKLDDFIKREEIEMTYFIASFLEDMK